MSNIYKAPKSDLNIESKPIEGYGSIEKGIAGNYVFKIGDVLSEAWEKTNGAKGSFFFAFLLYMIAAIVISIPMEILQAALVASAIETWIIFTVSLVAQFIFNIILLPVMMGVFILGVRRSVNAPLEVTSIFKYYRKIIPLFLTMLVMYLMILLGYLFFIIPGIYLSISYMMAMPLVVEKGLRPWQALEVSRKTITHRWFAFFFLSIILTIIMMISIIPLGIGLIWIMPMMIIAYGILYRNMFGIEKETLSS